MTVLYLSTEGTILEQLLIANSGYPRPLEEHWQRTKVCEHLDLDSSFIATVAGNLFIIVHFFLSKKSFYLNIFYMNSLSAPIVKFLQKCM